MFPGGAGTLTRILIGLGGAFGEVDALAEVHAHGETRVETLVCDHVDRVSLGAVQEEALVDFRHHSHFQSRQISLTQQCQLQESAIYTTTIHWPTFVLTTYRGNERIYVGN